MSKFCFFIEILIHSLVLSTKMQNNFLNFNLSPSVEHIALVNVAKFVWMRKAVQKLLSDWCSCNVQHDYYIYRQIDKPEGFQGIESQIIGKVIEECRLQDILDDTTTPFRIEEVIKGMGFEILNWKSFHDDVFGAAYNTKCKLLTAKCMKYIQWLETGCIDYEATARKIFAGKLLTNLQKYRLCCAYCWKKEAAVFALKAHEYVKDTREIDGKCASLISFWNSQHFIESYCYEPKDLLYKHSAYANNEFALKYLKKLYPEILQTARIFNDILRQGDVKSAKILYLLLCQLNPDEQLSALKFKNNVSIFLDCLLNDWWYKDFYIYTFERSRNIITNTNQFWILQEILDNLATTLVGKLEETKFVADSKPYLLRLGDIFRNMTDEWKNYMFGNYSRFVNYILPYLDYEMPIGMDVLKLTLSNADANLRREFAFSDCNLKKCSSLLREKRFKTLNEVISFMVISDDDDARLRYFCFTNPSEERDVETTNIARTMIFKETLVEFEECLLLKELIKNEIKGTITRDLSLKDLMDWAYRTESRKTYFKQDVLKNLAVQIMLDFAFSKNEIEIPNERLLLGDIDQISFDQLRTEVWFKDQVCALAINLITDYEHFKAHSLLSWCSRIFLPGEEEHSQMRFCKRIMLQSREMIRAAREGGASLLVRIWTWFARNVSDIRLYLNQTTFLNEIIRAVLENWTRLEADYLIDYYFTNDVDTQKKFKISFVQFARRQIPPVTILRKEFGAVYSAWSLLEVEC